MKELINGPLAEYNQLYKEMDEIYHLYAKKHGVSDTALWLMYSLYLNDAENTQSEICSAWHYPPQTINSALKRMEKQGLILLDAVPGNQKNKLIKLSEKGREIIEKAIAPLVEAEQKAFQGLKHKEKAALFALTRKYTQLLKSQMDKI